MDAVFQQTYQISANQVDCFGRAKPSVLLYLAQEAATGHCDLLRLDWDTMASRHLFWAVIRTRVQINRLPVLGETVTVQTWPMPTTRTAYPRAVSITDRDGNELVRIISLWVLMDTESRAMVLPGKSGVDVVGQLRGCELTAPGSIAPAAGANTAVRRVGYTELDRNGHMNNTRYLDWVDDLLPASFHKEHPVREFTVCYLSEARENQTVQLRYQLLDGPALQVDGYDTSTEVSGKQTRIFSAQLLF
jgi:acyl-ACP thioesterase